MIGNLWEVQPMSSRQGEVAPEISDKREGRGRLHPFPQVKITCILNRLWAQCADLRRLARACDRKARQSTFRLGTAVSVPPCREAS